MRKSHYDADVTDDQWALIRPLLPPAKPGGRPAKTDRRDVINAIFYLLRTGCQWRLLPKDFPPKSAVWRYFNAWTTSGLSKQVHDTLRRKLRTSEKPY